MLLQPSPCTYRLGRISARMYFCIPLFRERGTGMGVPGSGVNYLCQLVSKMGCVTLPNFWYHFQHGKALQMLLSHRPASTLGFAPSLETWVHAEVLQHLQAFVYILQTLSTCNFVACPTHPKNLSLTVISGFETPVKTKTTGFGCSAKQSLSIKRRLIFLSG